MNAQQEVGIDECPLERKLDARIETAALRPSLVEELQQGGDVCLCHRPPVREACHFGEDLRGTTLFVGTASRLTYENVAATRRVFRSAEGLIWPADLHRADAR